MFVYEKRLEYPIRIKNTNPKLAALIISQYGGPDGSRLRRGRAGRAGGRGTVKSARRHAPKSAGGRIRIRKGTRSAPHKISSRYFLKLSFSPTLRLNTKRPGLLSRLSRQK